MALILLNAGISGVLHQTQFMWGVEQIPGFCAYQADTLYLPDYILSSRLHFLLLDPLYWREIVFN